MSAQGSLTGKILILFEHDHSIGLENARGERLKFWVRIPTLCLIQTKYEYNRII